MSHLQAQRTTYTMLHATNHDNAEVVDKHGFPITIDQDNDTITLYHGTRAPKEKILQEGLLIRAGLVGDDTKMQMINEVLNGEFGVTKEQVPDWVWKSEYTYEMTKPPHIHMSINFGTAAGYSHQGCEIKAQVRRNMYYWLLSRRYGDLSLEELSTKVPGLTGIMVQKLALEKNGKESHVFQVELPLSYVFPYDVETWQRTLRNVEAADKAHPSLEVYKALSGNVLEIRCVRHIPPEMIKGVWQIHFKDKVGFKYDIEEAKA